MAAAQSLAPNDWLDHPEVLPPRPKTFTEAKYSRYFAIDIQGRKCHDQYVFLAPNGVAVIGIAPSHPLVATHRRATGYLPLDLKYIPPCLDHIQAEELAAAAPDDDAQEDAAIAVPADQADNQAPASASPPCGGSDALDEAAVDVTEPPTSNDPARPAAAETTGGLSRGAGGAGQRPASSRPPPPDIEPFGAAECSRIGFDGGAARHLAGTKASGKKRGRSGLLRGTSVLAAVERRGGGPSFPLLCLLNGQLLEVNERLAKSPSLLFDRPCREGYLALLLPTPDALHYMRTRLLGEEDYLRLRGLTAEELL